MEVDEADRAAAGLALGRYDRLRMTKPGVALALAAVLTACASAPAGPSAPPLAPSASEEVARAVSIEEDPSVFTLFALLNAAGYDEENSPQGMHPARVEVRKALERRLPSALSSDIRRYYRAKGPQATPWHYSVVALSTSGPPDFRPTAEWTNEISRMEAFAALADLQPLLRRFHREARIPSLYREVRPAYLAYMADYDAAVRRETAAVLAYLRVRPDSPLAAGTGEHGGARVIPNLLESFEKAFSFNLGGRFISVEGPQRNIGYNPHEFVHAVTNPLSYDPRHAGLQAPAASLLAEARRAMGENGATRSLAAFFDECLVRAVALRYLARGDSARLAQLERAMLEEYRGGHILERFFWERLGAFEQGSGTLADAYPAMLDGLDPKAELERWRAFRAAAPAR